MASLPLSVPVVPEDVTTFAAAAFALAVAVIEVDVGFGFGFGFDFAAMVLVAFFNRIWHRCMMMMIYFCPSLLSNAGASYYAIPTTTSAAADRSHGQ